MRRGEGVGEGRREKEERQGTGRKGEEGRKRGGRGSRLRGSRRCRSREGHEKARFDDLLQTRRTLPPGVAGARPALPEPSVCTGCGCAARCAGPRPLS